MNRIRELRKNQGWLQSDLAMKLNTTAVSIGRYETEQRQLDPETILKLCDIFDVTADYLLGRSEVRSFDLSDEEAALLDGFRALSPAGREYVQHSLALAALAHTGEDRTAGDMEAVE